MSESHSSRRLKSLYLSIDETAELRRKLLEEPSDTAADAYADALLETDERALRISPEDLEQIRGSLAAGCMDAIRRLVQEPAHRSHAARLQSTLKSRFSDLPAAERFCADFSSPRQAADRPEIPPRPNTAAAVGSGSPAQQSAVAVQAQTAAQPAASIQAVHTVAPAAAVAAEPAPAPRASRRALPTAEQIEETM